MARRLPRPPRRHFSNDHCRPVPKVKVQNKGNGAVAESTTSGNVFVALGVAPTTKKVGQPPRVKGYYGQDDRSDHKGQDPGASVVDLLDIHAKY